MKENKCLITNLEVEEYFQTTYLDQDKRVPIKNYIVQINGKIFKISTLDMREDFIVNENNGYSDFLIEYRPKIIELIFNNDERIRGVFSWEGYKNYSELLNLKLIIKELFDENNLGA